MKHSIDKSTSGDVDIDIELTGGNQAKVLDGLRRCQSGNCGCPTQEYDKLQTIDVSQHDDGIAIHLEAKAGADIDTQEVEKCLSWMKQEAEKT